MAGGCDCSEGLDFRGRISNTFLSTRFIDPEGGEVVESKNSPALEVRTAGEEGGGNRGAPSKFFFLFKHNVDSKMVSIFWLMRVIIVNILW